MRWPRLTRSTAANRAASDPTPTPGKAELQPASVNVYGLPRAAHRAAVRSFASGQVPVEAVRSLVDAARWTGSARNRQPWRFVAVYDQGTRADLSRLGAYAGHLATAPVALVLLSPTTHQLDTEFDIGRVAQSLTLIAADRGLGCCIVSLYPDENAESAARLVGGDDGWSARHAIAIGVPRPTSRTGFSAIPLGRHDPDVLFRTIL
ncbi:MAG TPA: nitroreductase family protein [Acidimicrobiales bacterium]